MLLSLCSFGALDASIPMSLLFSFRPQGSYVLKKLECNSSVQQRKILSTAFFYQEICIQLFVLRYSGLKSMNES